MAIIQPPVPATPIVLTTEQKQANLKRQTVANLNALYQQMIKVYNTTYGSIWTNPNGLTQAEALAAFGTDATSLFTLGGLIANLVNTAHAGSITNVSAPVAVTFNGDGSVTLT